MSLQDNVSVRDNISPRGKMAIRDSSTEALGYSHVAVRDKVFLGAGQD